jgi:hypothetical protein
LLFVSEPKALKKSEFKFLFAIYRGNFTVRYPQGFTTKERERERESERKVLATRKR